MAHKLTTDMYSLDNKYLNYSIFRDLFFIVAFTNNLVLQLVVVILNDKRGYTNQKLLPEFEGSSPYLSQLCRNAIKQNNQFNNFVKIKIMCKIPT